MYIHFIHIYTWIDAESGIHYFNLCNLIIRNLNHNFNTYYKEFLLGLKENDGREEKPLRRSCRHLPPLQSVCGAPLFPIHTFLDKSNPFVAPHFNYGDRDRAGEPERRPERKRGREGGRGMADDGQGNSGELM